jgi:hypothetical protein
MRLDALLESLILLPEASLGIARVLPMKGTRMPRKVSRPSGITARPAAEWVTQRARNLRAPDIIDR